MSKLNSFRIKIETGDPGTTGPVNFNINNNVLPLKVTSGGAESGQTLEGGYEIHSFAHSLSIVGPEKGKWNIKKMTVHFESENTEPYSVVFGEVTLDGSTEVNIWKDPPLPVFDV